MSSESETEQSHPRERGGGLLLYFAVMLACGSIALGVWSILAFRSPAFAAGAGALPFLFLIALVLLIFSGMVAAYHFANRGIERMADRRVAEGRSLAGPTALRGLVAAAVLYWFQKDWIAAALAPTGPFGETIPLAARVFALTPITGVIVFFGGMAMAELVPLERRPSNRVIGAALGLPILAIFAMSGYLTFSGSVPSP